MTTEATKVHSSIQAAPYPSVGGVNVEHAQRSEHARR